MDAAKHEQVLYEYASSVDALVPFFDKFRQLNVEPDHVFNDEHDLPPWLHGVAENTVHPVDAATLAAYTRLPAVLHRRSYWVKASSVKGVRRAVANAPADVQEQLRTVAPLCIYLMPTAPLADSQEILNFSTGVEQVPVPLVPMEGAEAEAAVEEVSIYNMADCEAKVAAFHTVLGVLEQLRQSREMVKEHRDKIAAEAQDNVHRAQETLAEYKAAKQQMEAAKAVGEPELLPQKLHMMVPFSRFLVAQEIAKVTTTAAQHMEALQQLLGEKEAQVEGFTKCLTFMGCAPPAPQPPVDAPGPYGHGGANNAN